MEDNNKCGLSRLSADEPSSAHQPPDMQLTAHQPPEPQLRMGTPPLDGDDCVSPTHQPPHWTDVSPVTPQGSHMNVTPIGSHIALSPQPHHTEPEPCCQLNLAEPTSSAKDASWPSSPNPMTQEPGLLNAWSPTCVDFATISCSHWRSPAEPGLAKPSMTSLLPARPLVPASKFMSGESAPAQPEAMSIFKQGFHQIYALGKIIGHGSFSSVRRAEHRDTCAKVAVKVFNKNSSMVKIQNVVKEVYEDSTKIYMVLELATGGNLEDRIGQGLLSEANSAETIADVLRAVQDLHSMGIVHRDLKPANILYVSNNPNASDYHSIKIADFGLANLFDISTSPSMRTCCGTRDYAAPEVIKLSQLPADSQLGDAYGPEVDVWSVGVILFAMLCGYLPFQSDSKVELFRLIVCGEYSFAEEQWSEVSAGAKDLVCNMLVVDPKRRFSAKQCLGHDWLCKTASSRIHPAEKAESGPHRDYGHDVAGSHISPVRQTRTTVDSAAAGMDQNKEMRSRKKASCAVGLQKWLAWSSHR